MHSLEGMRTLILSYAESGTLWGLIVSASLVCACVAFVGFGAVLAVIDARTHRLPNVWVGRLSATCAFFLTLATFASLGVGEFLGFAWALAAAGGALVFLGLRWITRKGLGLGDVKLAPVLCALCAVVSWGHILLAGILMCLIAGVHALIVMIATRNPRAFIAFGPAMLCGTGLALAL